MTPQDLIATAAHLHVAMRRKMGRVTDTEWMASDFNYAQAMSTLAQRHADETQDGDLRKWADRLLEGWLERLPRPAAEAPSPRTEPRGRSPSGGQSERYVVGLRC